MPPAKPSAPKKRNRKRKRRADFSSSEPSSSDSSDSGSDNEQPAKVAVAVSKAKAKPKPVSESESSSSSSSEDSGSSSDESEGRVQRGRKPTLSQQDVAQLVVQEKPRRSSPSPSPPPPTIPSFLPQKPTDDETMDIDGAETKEQEMKDRFRKFWMSCVADGFRDDLEEIRKEPNLTKPRMALLIDSLASGADVFTSESGDRSNDINEVEVVLG